MHSCPHKDVPCHRIVNRFGQFSKNFAEIQKALLEEEGVAVKEGDWVDLKKYIWNGTQNLSGCVRKPSK